ncbi:MAG: FtsX-like permease family protein [Erysipelotrichia bacterium]|nr:FtsX-like permease family protein [Erysipelotrichia bacterium]
MGFLDNIEMALASLRSNKMRALLTMLGIIIGIGSVIAIMTVGGSLSGSITDSLKSFGITNITVSVTEKTSSSSGGVSTSGRSGSNMGRMFSRSTMSDSDLITSDMINEYKTAYADDIDYLSLTETVGNSTVTVNANEATVNISGTNEDYKAANDITLLTGRWINASDLEDTRKVCVVSDQFISDTFGDKTDGVGESFTVTMNGFTQKFYIVGIYEYEANSMFSTSTDITTAMYIPVTTAKKLMQSNSGYSSITIMASADADSTEFLKTTQQFFASFYTHNDSYTIEASNNSDMLSTMTEMMSQITLAISAIAAISLLVGGIGVMNIMLVSITERTREIGTRKALGATQMDIRMQFITESVIICLVGGALGIVLGLILGSVGASMLGYASRPSITAIAVSVLFSMGIGIFFGYYPANKAAKLDPIDALRYE